MAGTDLDYVKVVGRLVMSVADTAIDPDDEPDLLAPDQGGEVWLIPQTGQVMAAQANPPMTVLNSTIKATLDSDGVLTHMGKPGIKLVDLGSEKVNPRIPRNKAAYRVEFKNISFNGVPVNIASFTCHPVPGQDNDISVMAPVVGTGLTAITVGPPGVSVRNVVAEDGDLILTLSDGTLINAGRLPEGPPGPNNSWAEDPSDPDVVISAVAGQVRQDSADPQVVNIDAFPSTRIPSLGSDYKLPEKFLPDSVAASAALGVLEGLPQENRGDSWMDPARTNTRQSIGQRVALRTRGEFVNRAASSRTMEDHANIVLGGGPWAWTPGTRNLVLNSSTHLNNSKYLGTKDPARRGYGHAVRSFLTRLTSMAVVAANTRQWTYDSSFSEETTVTYSSTPLGGSTPAQGTVLSTGGKRFQTTKVGAKAYVNVTPSASGEADIVFVARTSGAGVHTVRDAATNAVLGTIDLSGAVAQETPATLRLIGLGTATRQLRVELTSGSSMTIDSLSVPLPPAWQVPIVFAPAPDVPNGGGNTLPAGDPISDYNAAQALYRAMLAEIVADFPSASVADMKPARANWPGGVNGVFNTDQRHLNDLGASQFASLIVAHLAKLPFSSGLNALVSTTVPAYTPPTTPAIPAGGRAGSGESGDPLLSATRRWRASTLTDGVPVQNWTDSVGGVVLSQAAEAQRPTVVTEGGLKFVRFDGVDDFLDGAGSEVRPPVETIARLVRLRAAPTASRRYFASSKAGGNRVSGVASALNNYVMNNSAVLSPTPGIAPNLGWHVLLEVHNGTSSVISIDGVETIGNAGAQLIDVLGYRLAVSQGDTAGSGSATPIDMAEITHWDRALDADERAAVVASLNALKPA